MRSTGFTNLNPAQAAEIDGTGPYAGIDAQYRLSDCTTLALDFDAIDQQSSRVSSNMLTFSVRRRFQVSQ